MVVAMSFQLWRILRLETEARRFEVERATALAERILHTALGSVPVLARLPADAQFRVRGGAVVVDDDVGWLSPNERAGTSDPVVEDRLARAARAEFGLADRAAAEREFDELLRAPLPLRQRTVVLAAAAWFDTRNGRASEAGAKAAELDRQLAQLDVAWLADTDLANAVAAAARLPRMDGRPVWLERVGPALPPVTVAGLPDGLVAPDAHRRVAARRALLRDVADRWQSRPPSPPFDVVGADKETIVWSLQLPDGTWQGAHVPLREWIEAVLAAGSAGELPEWPWAVTAEFGGDPADAFGGVPFVRGVRARDGTTLQSQVWLLPAITTLLLLAFGAAAWQQLRAASRESVAVRAHAEFLTTVTHELRTPLASIRLLGEMLAEGRARGREQEYYAMLAGESARLSMLIENVLDLGRIERCERAYDRRPTDLVGVVGETLALVEPLAAREHVQFRFGGDVACPASVLVDRGAFVQALVCVLDNARKYGAAGGVVDVNVREDGPDLRLGIRDRGPGVPADERERIFQRFVRGRAHAHGSVPGLGIGLHLARTIVRRLGGELRCEAPADGGPGTEFVFVLPRETPS